jgi:lantibiotic leader peptide-processing serine protease
MKSLTEFKICGYDSPTFKFPKGGTMRKAVLFLLLLLLIAACSQTSQPASPELSSLAGGQKSNPFGTVVVRFKAGTTLAQMNAAITAAGGEVITRIPKLRTVSALPASADFASKIKANAKVRAVFAEKVLTNPAFDIAAADAGITGKNDPALGNPGTNPIPDPWHDLTSFLGETNPEGILQWDDNRMNVRSAWNVTRGDRTVRVAVLDSGVEGAHKELAPNYDNRASANTIPCNLLTRQFGTQLGQRDCNSGDTNGHGTWVASRIGGAVNGFASNGVAPNVQIVGFKVLSTTLGGGLTTWIVDGMIRACDSNVDLINMSLGGRNLVGVDDEDTLLWVEAVNYCRSKGTAIFASAGNNHVKVNRVNLTIGNTLQVGIGQVDTGPEGIASIVPGSPLSSGDLRGNLVVPGGIPGVIMVSSTNNANGAASYSLHPGIQHPTLGLKDQLAYYSNYGSRIDIAAPGGARKLNVPRYDGGNEDILYGGWGTLAALTGNGEICQDPAFASLLTFACFKVNGAAFGWLQGTSMSSPNATGVAALTLAAHPELQGNPDGLLARLQGTARLDMVNETGPNDPGNTAPSLAGVPCATGWCHLKFGLDDGIAFSDAYGAGMVDAAAAVAP